MVLRTILGCLYVSVFVLQMARCRVVLTPLLSQVTSCVNLHEPSYAEVLNWR